MSRALRGGSAGEPPKTSALPYFHDGVKAIELIQKNNYGLRILPAFNYTDLDAMIFSDPASWIPYRDRDRLDAETQRPVFTDWYFPIKVHKMIGPGQRSFVSPLITCQPDVRDVDPAHNIWLTAKNSDNTDWKKLTARDEEEYNSPLRKYRFFFVMNVLAQVQQSVENRLVVMTSSTLFELKKKLNLRAGRGDVVLDPDWDEYVFGDVTSPYNGLWATVKPGVFNDAGMKTSLFYFGADPKDERPDGTQKYPIDPNTEWGRHVLASRYNIPDTEKVTKISTDMDILNYIVSDNYLPYELVQQACGHRWDVPPAPTRKTTFPGGSVRRDQAPALAPVPQTAAPLGRQFFVLMAGQAKGPFPEIMVRQMVVSSDMQVNVVGTSNWVLASSLGLMPPVPAPAPTPPPPPAPPLAPPAPPLAPPAPPLAPPAPPSAPPVPPMPQQRSAPPPPPGGPAGMPLRSPAPNMPPPQPGGVPAGAPPVGAPLPPGMPSRPSAPTAPPPPPPGVTSVPSAPPPPGAPPPPQSPVASPAPAALAAPATVPLTEAENTEYQTLMRRFMADGGAGAASFSTGDMQRMAELGQRQSEANIASYS